MGDRTRKELVRAVSELLAEKSLDKITIKEITDRCDLTRNTFYYNFTDIYDLLRWEFERQAADIVKELECDEPGEAFLHGLNYLIEKKRMVYHIYNSISRTSLDAYIKDITDRYADGIVGKLIGNDVDDEVKAIVVDFYKNAFIGSIQQWLDGGMKNDPRSMSVLWEGMLHGTIESSVEAAKSVRLNPMFK